MQSRKRRSPRLAPRGSQAPPLDDAHHGILDLVVFNAAASAVVASLGHTRAVSRELCATHDATVKEVEMRVDQDLTALELVRTARNVLSKLHNLERLELHGPLVHLVLEGAAHTNLRRLHMWGDGERICMARCVPPIARRFPRLKEIMVSTVTVAQVGMRALVSGLPGLDSLMMVDALSQEPWEQVMQCVSQLTQLEALCIHLAARQVQDLGHSPASLVLLNLDNVTVKNIAALSPMAALRFLTLTNVDGIDAGELDSLPPKLFQLKLIECKAHGTPEWSSRPRGLVVIKLQDTTYSALPGGPPMDVCALLPPSPLLLDVNLCSQALGTLEQAVAGLAGALRCASTSIESLHLELLPSQISSGDYKALGRLRAFTSLHSLTLHVIRTPGAKRHWRPVKLPYIASLPRLTQLRLHGNMGVRTQELASSVQHMRSMVCLDIEVSVPSARAHGCLACLTTLTGLRVLGLRDARAWHRCALPTGWLQSLTALTALTLDGGRWSGPFKSPSLVALTLRPNYSLTLAPAQGLTRSIAYMVEDLHRVSVCEAMPSLQRVYSTAPHLTQLKVCMGASSRVSVCLCGQ